MNNKFFKTNNRPFKVFETEEEWNRAVAEAAEEYLNSESDYSEEDSAYQNEAKSVMQRLLEEEQALKEKVPDFDLRQVLRENAEFRERILKGYPVEEAFYITNRNKAASAAQKKKIGIRENGRNKYMGAGTNQNIKNMSDEDFKKYINSIIGSKL